MKIIEKMEVQGYPWVAREGLSDQARQSIVTAYEAITDPTLLALMRAKKYVAVTEADYTALADQAAELGLLTRK